jgi:cell wall-associated NlpC family hydrolase
MVMSQIPVHDPRLTAARPDLAAEQWRGLIPAERYATGETMQVMTTTAPLFGAPRSDGPMQSEMLFGECFIAYERNDDGWCWGQTGRDGYVGYVPSDMLALSQTAPTPEPTHRVHALRSFVYPGATIKTAPLMHLSFASLLTVTGEKDGFYSLDQGGWIIARHLVPVDHLADDPATVAATMLGAPYLWGGRSSLGMDCSGLVQLALEACGIPCLRDSDMQQQQLGEALDPEAPLQRNDLVFLKGHVGLMLDDTTLLHANGHHMACVAEPLREARARIKAKTGHDIAAIKRINRQTRS